MTIVYWFLVFQLIHDFYFVFAFSRPGMVFTTFFYCLIIDNLKSCLTLSIVYCVVVRRFMHLSVNENEYVDPNIEKIPKQEN